MVVSKFQFGDIYIPPILPALCSWWIDAAREHFTERAHQEEPRMRCSPRS